VVNLGALWAAPLCAQLLRQDGHHVIDVESIARPDTGVPAFYSVLHKGHERLTLDLQTDAGHADLARLIREADVVIEASRPRALEEMGLSARTVMTDGRQRVWLRITGHGPDENRIAFGDDAAVAGGLVAWDANGPVFAGDAVADPLTGILGAALVQACIHEGGSWVVDLTMREVARYAASTGAQCYSW
jgi:crotonobetainyl-CoA:carnitine CoA-transferase CaiB-like acyl-CoA transferase